jgi:hypothetical protein
MANKSAEEILDNNEILKNLIAKRTSLIDQMKMEVILENLDKYEYLEICEMFEGKLPYQTPLK